VEQAAADLAATVKELETTVLRYDNLQVRYLLAQARIRLGAVLQARGRRPEASMQLRTGLEAMREVDKVFKLDTAEREYLLLAENLLAKNP
jgi:hypothetical protein